MVRVIREIVTVGTDGMIRVHVPDLQGARAEVIVLLEPAPVRESPAASVAALDALQQSLKLNRSEAQDWADRASQERKASSRL